MFLSNGNPTQSSTCNSVYSDGSMITVGDPVTTKWAGFEYKDKWAGWELPRRLGKLVEERSQRWQRPWCRHRRCGTCYSKFADWQLALAVE